MHAFSIFTVIFTGFTTTPELEHDSTAPPAELKKQHV